MRFPALRSRSFRLYEGGSLFALNGQWITRVLVGWIAWEMTGSASWVGLLSFFMFAPTILSSPLFGVVMDRVKLRPAAIWSYGIMTAGTFVLFVLHVTDTLTLFGLCAVTLVIGIAGSAERSVRVTIVPRMVDVEVMPNAVAIHASNFNVQRMIGPAIGGILIDQLGVSMALLINVIVMLPFMVALFFLKVRERDMSLVERKPFLTELWFGARYAALHPLIREAMVLTWLTSITVRGVLEILPAIADGIFERGAEGLGQMVAAGGAGALVASGVIALKQSRKWDGRIPVIGHVAVFIGLAGVTALGLADTWVLSVLFVGVAGFSGTMIGINMQSTIQLAVDEAYRGRVMSLWMVSGIGMSAAGALLLGSLADAFGLTETLVASGLVSIVIVVATKLALIRAANRTPGGPA